MTLYEITFSALLALCAGKPLVTDGFTPQRHVTRSFHVFFDMHQNKRLSKQSTRRWFQTQVMTCCLAAPNHYQIECWLIINKVHWHWSEAISQGITQPSITKISSKSTYMKFYSNLPGNNQWFNAWSRHIETLWDLTQKDALSNTGTAPGFLGHKINTVLEVKLSQAR